MAELKLRILLGDLEDDILTLLPKKHEHDNAQTIKQLQHRISVIKSQLQSMRKPVKKPEEKAEKIVEKAVEITPKVDRYNKRSGVNIPFGEDNIQYDADPLAPGYTRPTPMQALFYKQVKYYGLHAISDDDIDEFTEYLKTAKKDRIPLTYQTLRQISALMSGIKNTNNLCPG